MDKKFDYSGLSSSFAEKSQQDIMARYAGTMTNVIDSIRIGKGARNKPNMAGIPTAFAQVHDSATSRSYWNPMNAMGQSLPQQPLVRVEPDAAVIAATNRITDSILQDGKTPADAKAAVSKMVVPIVTLDSVHNQYVIHPYMKGVNDSIISNSSIPYWNIGYLYKVFKQPYAPSKAARLVSVESFGNAWCDVCAVFKEAFEGWGKISTVAHGNPEMTTSSPILNTFGTLMSQVYNISIDYQSSIAEDIAAGSGSPFISQGMADREKYAMMVKSRIRDQLIYFGDTESGFTGLKQSCTPTTYSGTPLNAIYASTTNVTKGSAIVKAMISWLADIMQSNHYMSKELIVNVSTFVWKALTATTYSDVYNPESPMETIKKHFSEGHDLGGGLKQLSVSFEVDPMLDPTISGVNSNPFNTEGYDLAYVTVPSVSSAMGDEQGLVILPEPLSNFIVPPMWSRQGQLYTMYSRIGDIIAPVEGTVYCVEGLGYQA